MTRWQQLWRLFFQFRHFRIVENTLCLGLSIFLTCKELLLNFFLFWKIPVISFTGSLFLHEMPECLEELGIGAKESECPHNWAKTSKCVSLLKHQNMQYVAEFRGELKTSYEAWLQRVLGYSVKRDRNCDLKTWLKQTLTEIRLISCSINKSLFLKFSIRILGDMW